MDAAAFLARLGPANFIRAIWPKKQLGPHPSNGEPSYAFYGAYTAEVAQKLTGLNRLGYSIYYGSNDPCCDAFDEKHVTKLRCIYLDYDKGEEPQTLKLPGGELVPPHLHYVTSPGKSQSLWLIEPIPAEHQNRIHGAMVNWHGHDASTGGAARLLRLPGFHNTKYPGKPLVSILGALNTSPIQAAVVFRLFGLDVKVAANLSNLSNRAQSGSGGTASAVVHKIDQAKAKAGISSPQLEADRRELALTGKKQNQGRDDLLRVLALVDPTERADWFKVGAALHFMFDAHEDGLELFERWSKLAAHKYEHGACTTLWRGFHADREHAAHLGTLCAMAARQRKTPDMYARLSALTDYGLLMSERLTIQVKAFRWHENIWVGDKQVVDSGSMINAEQAVGHFEPSLHYDEFAREERTDRGPFQDSDENILFVDTKALGNRWSQADCRAAWKRFARAYSRNPAMEFMEKMRGKWDCVSRLDTLLIRHLGAPDTPYVRELTQLHFIAMVRRAREPGCKYDYMPILQGPGEMGKSSLFKRIMPQHDWFTDAPSLDEDAKRFYPGIQGRLCVEFAELSGKSKGDLQKIKKIITQQADEYTAMYGRLQTKEPRIAVMVGTTNEAKVLRDMTGNRRFPIIPVTKELNFDALDAERDQIWAEAVFREGFHGDLRLSQDSMRAVEARQRNAMDYEEGVEEFLDATEALGSGFIAPYTFREYFGIEATRGKLADANKAKHAINQIKARMREMGWKDTENPMRVGKKTHRGLYKADVLGDIVEIVHSEMNGLHFLEDIGQ